MSQDRFSALLAFLNGHGIPCSSCDPCDCGCQCANSLIPLNGDASFRRYYRLNLSSDSFSQLCAQHHVTPHLNTATNGYTGNVIVVDAPPQTQKNREFIAINALLSRAKVLVSSIIVADIENGFMVLEDLGSTHFIDAAVEDERLAFYFKALVELTKIAAIPYDSSQYERLEQYRALAIKKGHGGEYLIPSYPNDAQELQQIYNTMQNLPPFDEAFIKMECGIFTEWLLDKQLHLTLSEAEQQTLNQTFDFLAQSLTSQSQVAMHRDYHSRNLMVTPQGCDSSIQAMLAVIDYQDMVLGPIGYDVASLVYDCYTVLSDASREKLLAFSYEVYCVSGILDEAKVSLASFAHMVKLCALQRHIKCLGLFYRLKLRDGKEGYLQYIPRVLDYVIENAKGFRDLADFSAFLQQRVAPALNK